MDEDEKRKKMSVNGHIVELKVMFASTSECFQMCSWGYSGCARAAAIESRDTPSG